MKTSSPALVLAALLPGLVAPALAQNGDKAGEEQPAVDRAWDVPPAPALTPEEALASFTIRDGYAIELAAGDPLVHDPVDVAFDARGRLWVCEMRGYMPDADGTGELDPTGRIAILEDADGDGVFDTRTDFAEDLVLPRGILPVRGGAIAILPPRLVFLADTDGDGRCDAVETIDEGGAFGAGLDNPEHAPNGPRFGLDNWLYLINHTKRYRQVDGTWVSEPVPRRGQWGNGMDDRGRFVYDYNATPVHGDRVPAHYLVRNPALGLAQGSNVRLVQDATVRPSRINPGVNRGYRGPTLTDAGYLASYTSACGPEVFRGTALHDVDRGAHFTCEPAANLLRRNLMVEEDGRVSGAPDPGRLDFLTSTDERFRPVNLRNGPDGALYVVDLYRGILQHRVFLTSFLRRQIEERGLDEPVGLGRVWRITRADHERDDPDPYPADLSPAELVRALGSANGWLRDTAQRELVERGADDAETLAALAAAAREGDARQRLHALWTLEGLGHFAPAFDERGHAATTDGSRLLVTLFEHETEPHLVATLVRLSERLFDDATLSAWSDLVMAAEGPGTDPVVRWQLAHSLGERSPDPAHALVQGRPAVLAAPLALAPALLWGGQEEDAILRRGLLSGLAGRELDLVDQLDPPAVAWDPESTAFGTPRTLEDVGRCVGRRGDEAEVTRLFERVLHPAFPDDATVVQRRADRPAHPADPARASTGAPSAGDNAPRLPLGRLRGLAEGHAVRPFPGAAWARPASLPLLRGFVEVVEQRAPDAFAGPAPAALAALLAHPDDALRGLAERADARLTWDAASRTPEALAREAAIAAASKRGAAVYAASCAACHQPDGTGMRDLAPPLGDPAWLGKPDGELAGILLEGLSGPIHVDGERWDLVMPPWRHLSDQELADVLTHVLDRFGGDHRRLVGPAAFAERRSP